MTAPPPEQDGVVPILRRRFVTGIACAGTLSALSYPSRRARAFTQPMLTGDRFDLRIAAMPVNLTGRPSLATTVNGSLPGPTLRWREGDTVTVQVDNTLDVATSIHWHGIRVTSDMDGVPGLSFAGIAPGERFTYRIRLHQSGTYWYHSHSGFQEQTGLHGALIVESKTGPTIAFDHDHVVLLSDWTDSSPQRVLGNLKMQSDYYDFHQRDAAGLPAEAGKRGLIGALRNRLMWGGMRMSATDIADVSGATYTYLLNGRPPASSWTGLFRPGERLLLRFINASSMTFFDVRIPGLQMTVVAADGNAVEPVPVDEFRIGVAETYDVIVTPTAAAHAIFAQSEDRSGFACGMLATRPGLSVPLPAMDPRPVRTMADMGMAMAMHGDKAAAPAMAGMAGMASMPDMPGMDMRAAPDTSASAPHADSVGVDNIASDPIDRLGDPGDGLRSNGRRVLTYKDLRATRPGADPRPPSRDITLHLTGNMQRYIWGFDGLKFSQAEPIHLARGERVRFTLINDTMMEHPIHLHGLWSELENGQDEYRPYKHTIIVQPGEKLSYLVTADTPGLWAYHCHLLYHMEMGMFRTVVVS